jgi:hypothetical protein
VQVSLSRPPEETQVRVTEARLTYMKMPYCGKERRDENPGAFRACFLALGCY